MSKQIFYGVCVVFGVLCCCGCSRFPAPPERPDMDPSASGRRAIEQYDTNGDGKIDSEEIRQSPPLMEALKSTDKDGDGALTGDEIAARIRQWIDGDTAIMDGTTTVLMDGQPLEGATVVFEPEPFLGQAFKPCQGVTDQNGVAVIAGPDEKHPGIYVGLYRIRISKKVNAQETVPARYNTQTELAREIAEDSPSTDKTLYFRLKSG